MKKLFKLVKVPFKTAFLFMKTPFLRHDEGIKKYKNLHKGERCFIVATGPSLKAEDLDLIKNEYSFSMNSIMKSFGKTDWRPTYYVVTDPVAYEACKPLINENDFNQMFFRKGLEKSNVNTDVLRFSVNSWKFIVISYLRRINIKIGNKPSRKIRKYFNDAPSVVFSIIQLAIYMGFSEIYLLGQDCNYETKTHSDIASVEYKIKPTNRNALSIIEAFESYSTALNRYSLKIYNATRGGKLEVFPRVNLDDIVKKGE